MDYLSSLSDFWNYSFLTFALIGCILLGHICGLLSPLIVAKKYAFIGEGIGHSTLLGLSVALSIFGPSENVKIFLLTLFTTLFLISFLAKSTFRQKLPSDTLIGIFLTSTLATGILIHNLFLQGRSDLLSSLFGNIILLETWDLYLLIFLFILNSCAILIPYKKWIFLTYDEEGAMATGISAQKFHYIFFFLLTILIVSSIKLAGTILVNTLLIIPGSFAYKFAKNMKQVFIFSIIFSIITSLIGLSIANWKGLSPGATLSITQFIFFITSVFLKKLFLKYF